MLSLSLENRLQSLLWMGLMGLCDILDGAVAKRSKRATPFGAFLDSTTDRLTEGLVFLGVLIFFYRRRDLWLFLLTYAALIGSYLVSYTRARGENFIESCKVGFWERPERLCLLMLGTALDRLKIALWLIAAGSFLTALHRLLHQKATLQKTKLSQRGVWSFLFWPYPRFSTPYLLYALTVILLVLFIQP